MIALQEKTGVINPRLHSRPRLRADCRQYRQAFLTLSNARQFNQAGLMPIAVSEVSAYVELADVEKGFAATKLLRIVQAMDATHLAWWAKKRK